MTEREELQTMRATLFETVGRVGDLVDVLNAITISSRLAGEKLDRIGATLAKIAVRVGEPTEE
jgi:hypothetical protein